MPCARGAGHAHQRAIGITNRALGPISPLLCLVRTTKPPRPPRECLIVHRIKFDAFQPFARRLGPVLVYTMRIPSALEQLSHFEWLSQEDAGRAALIHSTRR